MEDFVYQTLIFVIGCTAALAGFGVVLCASPIYCALYLIGNMVCLAMLYLLYHAEFIAVVQIIVYAGAVMILFIFIIALLGAKKELKEPSVQRSAALSFVGLLFGEMLMTTGAGTTKAIEGVFDEASLSVIGSAKAVGIELFSRHLIPFELASILLLIAAVGIICLAKFPLNPLRRRIR
ncbi:MAG: NADH-quinone oxidoreductase subunit J [Nitrospinales bacterium]